MSVDLGELFDWKPEPPRRTRADQIFDDFKAYHKANPIVWRLIVQQAFIRIREGYKNYGIAKCIEDIRWTFPTHLIQKSGGLKIQNNFRAYYARGFHARYPEHAGFFRTRTRPSASQSALPGDPAPHIDPPEKPDADLDAKLKDLLKDDESDLGESDSQAAV